MDETEEYFDLLIGRHISAVAATSHVAVRECGTGSFPSRFSNAMLQQDHKAGGWKPGHVLQSSITTRLDFVSGSSAASALFYGD